MANAATTTADQAEIDDNSSREDDGEVDPEIFTSPPVATATNDESAKNESTSGNRHFIVPKDTSTFNTLTNRRSRRRDQDLRAYPGWEKPPEIRQAYHEYVHSLVEGGWDMMRDLDKYLSTDIEDADLAISVLDILADGSDTKRWPDIHDESDLVTFMAQNQTREPGSVRFYLTEQKGGLASSVIEALGAGLDLDPRFFQWSLVGHKHVLSPSHRHHAPYARIGFGVPKLDTPNRTDAERFAVTVYVKPDDVGDGWTGIILFSSHTKVRVSPYNLFAPPAFSSPRPVAVASVQRSFRELYLAVFPSMDLATAKASPFYAIHVLLRLNYVTWSDVINSIRAEDRRTHGISDTSVGHAEEIGTSHALVMRGGSLGWKGRDEPLAVEVRSALEEDFRHLVQDTELLWQERDKMAAVRQRRAENRWNLLTNTFTYVFAPVTIISGIYGMNVSEIVGNGPNIWQFFVAVIVLNFVVLFGLAIANWIHILQTHKRKAGWREVIGFVLGRTKHMH